MKFRNTDPSFGDTVNIFEVNTVAELTEPMKPFLRAMAKDHVDNVKSYGEDVGDTFEDEVYQQLIEDFELALEVIP